MSGREKELQELQKQVGALIEQVDYLNRLLVLEKQKAKSIETVQELSEQLIAKRETEIQELKEQVQRITAGTLERARKDKHLIVQMREANELLSAENSLLKINIAHHADLLSQLEKAHVDLVILRDNKDRIIEILKSEVVAAKEETQDALESAEALKKLHADRKSVV